MHAIKIGGDANKDEVKIIIGRYFANSSVNIQEDDYDGRFEFCFSPGKKKEIDDISFYHKIANLVNDIIFEIYIKYLIKDRVSKICSDYSTPDKEEIISYTHSNLLDENYFTREKKMVHEEILNHLIENNVLLIDGFIKFKLRKFLYMIDIAIEKAISQLEVEKEYQEFLNMLQYFADIQEPKAELINVIISDGDYFLLDENNNLIEENKLFASMEKDFLQEDISKADLLVSSLIVLSPKKLIIHIKEGEEKELVELMKQVFDGRVEFCSGCEICKSKSKLKKG
ncbi:MAG TPA: putative sporulation protein YtxC [Tissierellaceae bacterium]